MQFKAWVSNDTRPWEAKDQKSGKVAKVINDNAVLNCDEDATAIGFECSPSSPQYFVDVD
jgi:hypothetical protein